MSKLRIADTDRFKDVFNDCLLETRCNPVEDMIQEGILTYEPDPEIARLLDEIRDIVAENSIISAELAKLRGAQQTQELREWCTAYIYCKQTGYGDRFFSSESAVRDYIKEQGWEDCVWPVSRTPAGPWTDAPNKVERK